MQISIEKCALQIYIRKRKYEIPPLYHRGRKIELKKEVKFLGVIFDAPKLTFKPHIT